MVVEQRFTRCITEMNNMGVNLTPVMVALCLHGLQHSCKKMSIQYPNAFLTMGTQNEVLGNIIWIST